MTPAVVAKTVADPPLTKELPQKHSDPFSVPARAKPPDEQKVVQKRGVIDEDSVRDPLRTRRPCPRSAIRLNRKEQSRSATRKGNGGKERRCVETHLSESEAHPGRTMSPAA